MAAASRSCVGKHVSMMPEIKRSVAAHCVEVGVLLVQHARDNNREDIAEAYEAVIAQRVVPYL